MSESTGNAHGLANFLARAFQPDQVAKWQSASQDDDRSDNPAFKFFVIPYAKGECQDLTGCTFRHVVKFLDSDETLTDHEWRTASFDWFSSNAQAFAIKAKKVTARQYAQALAEHKVVSKAESAVLA